MTHADVDVVVLGLGVHGSAAAAELARRGHSVIALEQFEPAHERGSSHGRTRMIRRAYPNPVWNDFVDRAYRGWEELERESGRTLVRRAGGLYAHRGQTQLQGPAVEQVEAAGVAAIMPSLRIPDGYGAVYDPAAGVLEAADALLALRERAARHGADLRFGTGVRGWDVSGSGVVVSTQEAGDIRAQRLVVAAGPWAASLVPVLAPLLEVWRILTLTVAPGQRVAMPPQLGAFSVDRPEGLLFGIPDAAGNGLKIGVDAGQVWDPHEPAAAASPAEIEVLRHLIAEHVAGIDTTEFEAAACLYTMTEDKRFILGPLAEAPEVTVVSACSGHGFKFGAAVGEAVADLHDGVARDDLAFISTTRRGL